MILWSIMTNNMYCKLFDTYFKSNLGAVTLGPAMKRPGGPGKPNLPGAPGSPWTRLMQAK